MSPAGALKLVECPRDAWQGLSEIIPAEEKAGYLLELAACGFRHMDAVSFVSPGYVPQTADSEAVMDALAAGGIARSGAEIIGIVVNERGLERARAAAGVTTIGYPHSLSETFLRANAHTTLEQSRSLVNRLVEATAGACGLVVYLSMAFGNPYGDLWSPGAVADEAARLVGAGVRQISLADTVGLATAEEIRRLLDAVLPASAGAEIGVHLHARSGDAAAKVLAAEQAGCRRFDSALTGLGGCPFAGDELVGNIPTEVVVRTLDGLGYSTAIAPASLERALERARELRRRYARA